MDPFVANTGQSIANSTFDGWTADIDCSYVAPAASPAYTTSYGGGDGSETGYINSLGYSNGGYRRVNGVSYYNGMPLDLAFLDVEYSEPYFNHSAGGFQQ